MIVERMETSPRWSCSIQLAEENWATRPSPYTKDGETFTARYEVGAVSPIDDSFCTRFHIDTQRAACALFSLPLFSNNKGILGADSEHTILPAIREIIYSGEWYIPPSEADNVGSVELDFSLFLDTCYVPGAHHFRWTQLNGEGSSTYEWDITNGENNWQPTGISGEPLLNNWNRFSLQIDVDAQQNFTYHSITMNGVKSIIDWTYSPITLEAHSGWWGAQPNFQIDVLSRPLDIWARNLTVQLTKDR
jgi:hypothetical protein